MTYLEKAKNKFYNIANKNNLLKEHIIIKSRVLTPLEAIGNPDKDNYPILIGKERILEAKFKDGIGHVFTDMPGNYSDTLKNILNKKISNNFHRAVIVASMNAVMRHLGLIEGTIHCRDGGPENCAQKLVDWIKKHYSTKKRIALIGFQPAFVEKLSENFTVNVLDLNSDNFGEKYGVPVLDGSKFYKDAIQWSDIVICTGTVFVNNTLENIVAEKPIKDIIFYGVTVAGIARLLDLQRICFCSK